MNTPSQTRFKLLMIVSVIVIVGAATLFSQVADASYQKGAGNAPQWTTSSLKKADDPLWYCMASRKCSNRYSTAVYRCFSKGQCRQLFVLKNRLKRVSGKQIAT
jgi:hypothetical protein